MTERECLFQAACDNPHDHAARLIYADWLEEHDEAVMAIRMRTLWDDLAWRTLPLPSSLDALYCRWTAVRLATIELWSGIAGTDNWAWRIDLPVSAEKGICPSRDDAVTEVMQALLRVVEYRRLIEWWLAK